MQRVEETAGKFCPIRLRQLRCLSQELCYVPGHARNCTRRNVRSFTIQESRGNAKHLVHAN